jgi:HEAT repeat protein
MFGNSMSKVTKAIEKKNAAALITLADSKDMEVRQAALIGLGKVGGEEVSNYLITQLASSDPAVRITVANALALLGDMHTKAHVSAQMTRETDPKVRDALGKAMASIKGY